MPVPPAPPPLEQLGFLPFSFDPAICGIEPNEWNYRGCTWAEMVIVNARTGTEIAIPRRLVGAISSGDDCGIAVRLLKKLEFRSGAVRPVEHRVIVLSSVESALTREPAAQPAPVIPIRLPGDGRSKATRLLLYAFALGMAGCVLFAYLYRGEIIDSRATLRPPARAAQF
jgi:hypothetical protein